MQQRIPVRDVAARLYPSVCEGDSVPAPAAIALVLGLQFVTVFLGFASIAACSEGSPLETNESACEVVTSSILSWFLAVLWPSAFFAATQLVPGARRHSVATAALTIVLAFTFWAYVLLTA